MRLTVIASAAALAAPAFAQEAPTPQTAPPEGFYRNIDGAYDLLLRPDAFSEIRQIRVPHMGEIPDLLAQLDPQSAGGIDWSKPVVGVDAPLPTRDDSDALPVEVYTLDQLKRIEGPSVEEFVKSLSKPAPPPCEPPPTANAPANKPAGPTPCPAR